jgi:hypothetical protein
MKILYFQKNFAVNKRTEVDRHTIFMRLRVI